MSEDIQNTETPQPDDHRPKYTEDDLPVWDEDDLKKPVELPVIPSIPNRPEYGPDDITVFDDSK